MSGIYKVLYHKGGNQMIKNPYPGKFIVLEGLDGSGQDTQGVLLKVLLSFADHPVFLSNEPTDGQFGRRIRRILRKEEVIEDPLEFQKLYVQDREEDQKLLIVPTLKKGTNLILVRYALSTIAFGGINVDMDILKELNKGFIAPDLIILLNASPEVCLERIGKRSQGFEFFETNQKLTKVRENYLSLVDEFGIRVVNGELKIEEVFELTAYLVKEVMTL